jgi:alpha/beta superfamily hydrolase
MNIPTWIKPAAYGAVAGAAALAIIGFNWGGWVTSSTAKAMADDASTAALVSAMTPYCVAMSKSDANSMQVLTSLKAASSYDRTGIVEKAGWATPLGAVEPNRALAKACITALALN